MRPHGAVLAALHIAETTIGEIPHHYKITDKQYGVAWRKEREIDPFAVAERRSIELLRITPARQDLVAMAGMTAFMPNPVTPEYSAAQEDDEVSEDEVVEIGAVLDTPREEQPEDHRCLG